MRGNTNTVYTDRKRSGHTHAKTPMDINALIAKCSNTLSDVSESEASIKPTERTPALLRYSALRTFALVCQVFLLSKQVLFSVSLFALRVHQWVPVHSWTLMRFPRSWNHNEKLHFKQNLPAWIWIYSLRFSCSLPDETRHAACHCNALPELGSHSCVCLSVSRQGRSAMATGVCVYIVGIKAARRRGSFKGVKASLTSAAAVSRAALTICGRSLGCQWLGQW